MEASAAHRPTQPRAPGSARRVRRVLGGLRRLVDLLPLAGRGLGVAALAGAAYLVYARGHLDLVLLVVSLLGLGLWLLCLLAVLALAGWVRHRWPRDSPPAPRATLEAGSPHVTGFVGPSAGWLPLLRVRWEVTAPAGARVVLREQGWRQHEELVVPRRGLHEQVTRQVIVEDLLGLARMSWPRTAALPLLVLPGTGRGPLSISQGPVAGDGVSHPEGRPEGDLVELRRYAPGDPLRHVVWKVFARTRRLIVRAPERSTVPSRRTLAYLVVSPADEAAAGTARNALLSGVLGDRWSFGADGGHAPATSLPAALELLARSATAEPGLAADLPAFLHLASPRTASRLVVFAAPTLPPDWLGRVRAAAEAAQLPLTLVLAADRIESSVKEKRGRIKRLFFLPNKDESSVDVTTLGPLLDLLSPTRIPWQLVERATGRSQGASSFTRLAREAR